MDEQEFDAIFQQPYKREDAVRMDSQWRRCGTLAAALWGRTPDDLRSQLLAPHPEIPAGFALADFQELQRTAEATSASLGDPGSAWFSRLAHSSQTILVGTQTFTVWEALCEIIRRAIEYLENR
ncbi:MAG: hypothetical protein ACRD51_07965 [Candidatus Acidiferrum sp.]